MDCERSELYPIDIPTADEASEFGQRAAYDAYLPEAMALSADEVAPTYFDVGIAYDNIQIGLRSLEAVCEHFLAMPGVEVDALERLRGLSLALLFASRKVAQTVDSKIEADVDLKEMRRLRAMMLDGYRNAIRAGLVPKAPYDAIIKGNSNEDAAADCIDLAALYRIHEAALAGKTPVTSEDLVNAERLAQRARDLIALEGGIRGSSSGDVKKAADVRNRFGVLLVRAHDIALRAAPFLFGNGWKDHVPTRQSRRALALRQKKTAKARPAESAPSES